MKKQELRQDPITGDWVIIAPGRSNRPLSLIEKNKKRVIAPVKGCPFEDPQAVGNPKPSLIYPFHPSEGKWQLQVFANKYPALSPQFKSIQEKEQGPYTSMSGRGYHELIVTRHHTKNFPQLKPQDAFIVLIAVRERFLTYQKDKDIKYGFFFHNWGPTAGASVFHPHYQLVGLPIIPPEAHLSLQGSKKFYQQHKKYAYSSVISFEKKYKQRIIAENDGAIAFTRYASKEPFDIRIFPKQHLPFFEQSSDDVLKSVSQVLQQSLKKMSKNLKDPDYNFFLHSAPLSEQSKYSHYHWHIDVVPKISISAGMEVGSGVEVTIIDPDDSAKILRK